jgi:hypothetical protein
MSESPHLQALLAELLGLNELDAQLPLPILINLHRPQLRAPLENLAAIAGDSWRTHDDYLDVVPRLVQRQVHDRWPALRNGDAWRGLHELDELTRLTEGEISNLSHTEFLQRAGNPEPRVVKLLQESLIDWRCYDPLYELHMLAWPQSQRDAICQLLEIELGLTPETRELILAYGTKP